MNIKFNSWKGLLFNLTLILALGTSVVLGFFYLYLPSETHHKETITVPNLVGRPLEDVERFLKDRNLQFVVTQDSGYSTNYSPLSVLQQNPKAGFKVKENRKIYISLNAKTPPMIGMPNLIDGSLKNAKMILASYGLEVGNLQYVPDLAENAVLSQLYLGKKIKPGTRIAKGSSIDLVIGDGLSKQNFEMPDLTGMDQEEANFNIQALSLQTASVTFVPAQDSLNIPGTIFQQNPLAGEKVRAGQLVDLWIIETDSTTLEDSPSDNISITN
ncbi:PASTA domain-containing protein [Cytophagales bacterium RKSG123]|nr:PASTA domain-containing protein [Xanthovirga aplysinae]